MSKFEARAHLKVRDGQLEGFKRQAAEMMRVTQRRTPERSPTTGFLAKTAPSAKSTKLMLTPMLWLSTR